MKTTFKGLKMKTTFKGSKKPQKSMYKVTNRRHFWTKTQQTNLEKKKKATKRLFTEFQEKTCQVNNSNSFLIIAMCIVFLCDTAISNSHIFCKHIQYRTFIMANNDISYIDWQSSNLTETFKLFKQQLELYFVVNKIKIEQQVNYILLRVGNGGLKKYNTWLLMEEEKHTPEIIFNKFIEQLENFRINRLKWMTYKQEAEESLDDFVNRCRRMTQRCLLTEHEQQ